MSESSDELRREFAQTLLESRRQGREIAGKIDTILDEWCESQGVTRAQLDDRAAAAARAEAEDDAL